MDLLPILQLPHATDGTVLQELWQTLWVVLLNEYPNSNKFCRVTQTKSIFAEFDGHCLIDGVLNYIGTLFLTGDHKIFKTGWDILKNPKLVKLLKTMD